MERLERSAGSCSARWSTGTRLAEPGRRSGQPGHFVTSFASSAPLVFAGRLVAAEPSAGGRFAAARLRRRCSLRTSVSQYGADSPASDRAACGTSGRDCAGAARSSGSAGSCARSGTRSAGTSSRSAAASSSSAARSSSSRSSRSSRNSGGRQDRVDDRAQVRKDQTPVAQAISTGSSIRLRASEVRPVDQRQNRRRSGRGSSRLTIRPTPPSSPKSARGMGMGSRECTYFLIGCVEPCLRAGFTGLSP